MAAHLKAFKIYFSNLVWSNQNTFYRHPSGDAVSSERVKESSFMCTLNNSSVHLMIYTLWVCWSAVFRMIVESTLL